MTDAHILVRALSDPQSVLVLRERAWTALLCIAHVERLSATLAHRLAGLAIPPAAARVLDNARRNAEAGRTRALWEVEMMRRALAPLRVPVVLLKGSAFVAAGLEAGQGRLIGDLDILVPRDALPQAEAALLEAGWEWLKADVYDDAYYRRWMHELPPLVHRDRDAMIDVHHTILPLTAGPRPDAASLLADSVDLGNGLRILNPQDMIVHAAAHLFADGDLSGGLRNLWDIHCLAHDRPVDVLVARARLHGLQIHVVRALRLSQAIFVTPAEGGASGSSAQPRSVSRLCRGDAVFAARIMARDDWGRETRPLLRFAFYLRSHLIRMPLPMLLRHLFVKWRKGRAQS